MSFQWASGYEAYSRLSPSFAKYLETLSAVHSAPFFIDLARSQNLKIQDPRGHPENNGETLEAVHPVIRTHPLTGYKSLFVNKQRVQISQNRCQSLMNLLDLDSRPGSLGSRHLNLNQFSIIFLHLSLKTTIFKHVTDGHRVMSPYGITDAPIILQRTIMDMRIGMDRE